MAVPGAKDYLKTRVMTASPEALQLMLWDGAIRFAEQALECIGKSEIEQTHNLLIKSQQIVLEMNKGLRDELAPDLCANMRKLYMFIYSELVMANVNKDAEPLDSALKIMRHQRETWAMLIEQQAAERAAREGGEERVSAVARPSGAAAKFRSNAFAGAGAGSTGGSLSVEG